VYIFFFVYFKHKAFNNAEENDLVSSSLAQVSTFAKEDPECSYLPKFATQAEEHSKRLRKVMRLLLLLLLMLLFSLSFF
jgi:hypothetical protein